MTAVLIVVGAALIVGLRRRRRTSTRPPGRRRSRRAAVALVVAMVGGTALIGQPALAAPFDCKEAPEPDRPGSGLVGSLDPPSLQRGEPGSVYDEVGYAGQIWHNYDLGCGPTAALNPSTTTDTWMGNQTFNIAKFAVGGVNWSHYLIADGGELLTPLDEVISNGTRAMYEGVFTTWVGLALLVLGAVLLILALRGDLARQAYRGGFAVIALAIGAVAYLAPVNWAKAADGLLLDGVTQMQAGFLEQVGLGDRHTLPTVLTDQVVYTNWLRGEFGSADVPQATDLGRDLLRAQTFTKVEVIENQDGPDQVAAKKQAFTNIAGQVGDRYTYFQGKSGSRIGVGVLAVIQAVCIALFQLLSKVLVLVAMLLLRLMVMCAPAIAVLVILKPEVLPALLRVAGAALVNTLIVGALAGLHAMLVVSLFRPGAGIDLWLALLVTGVVTIVLWAVARPFRRLVAMVSLTRDQFGGVVPGAGTGSMSRAWARMRGADYEDRQERWWDERRAAASGAGSPDGADRPEAERAQPAGRAKVTVVGSTPTPAGAVAAGATAGAMSAAERRALPAGPGPIRTTAGTWPSWSDPGDADDRVLYRRPEDVAARAASRPIQPELVDGVPVYRIYRPRARQPAYDPTNRPPPYRAD